MFGRLTTLTLLLVALPLVFGKTALLIIDVQNCFLPGGSLAVTDGEQVIPVINNIRRLYSNSIDLTILTQDWHCSDHVSFASEHAGKNPYDQVLLQYAADGSLCTGACDVAYNVTQMLWPDHCVINTTSAEFSTSLDTAQDDIVVRKGYTCDIDSYSGFFDNGGFHQTELNATLRQRNITRVIVTGLALDYCVYYTSMDAKRLGFETYTVLDASRPVSNVTRVTAVKNMQQSGVKLIYSQDLVDVFNISGSKHVTGSVFLLFVMLIVCTVQT